MLWVYVVVTNMLFSCKHGGKGVSTCARFDGHNYLTCYYTKI